MKFLPFIYVEIKENRRLFPLIEIIFWPLISVSSLGLFTIFTNVPFSIRMFLFTGIMGWVTVYLSHHFLARGFMTCVWHNTLKQIFSSPISLKDLVIGHAIYGTVAAMVGFIIVSVFTMTFFDFNIFTLGVYLIPIVILGCLAGIVIGSIAVSLVVLLGLRVELLIWTIIDIIVFISGLYYSIAIFPKPVQLISQLFPVSYVFEGMRAMTTGLPSLQIFIKGYGVAFVWLVLSALLIRKTDVYARKTGFYEKYG